MNKLRKILHVTLFVIVSLVLFACGKPDISGKWYATINSEKRQINLQIDEDEVSFNYSFIDYKTGFFTVESEVKTGTLMTGKIKSASEIEVTEIYRTEEAFGSNPFEGIEKLKYSLSKDKETLSLSFEGEDENIDFVKKNPVSSLE